MSTREISGLRLVQRDQRIYRSMLTDASTHKPVDVRIAKVGDDDRHEIERYIHQIYDRSYGANIREFLPNLLALRLRGDTFASALGYRPADNGTLFLEAYLDGPIEHVLKERLGLSARRSDIVEVGNLAGNTPGGARLLIMLATAFFRGMGLRFVVFTATPALLNSFSRLSVNLVPLALASKERVKDAEKYWGRYYDSGPVVVLGDIRYGFHALRDALFMHHARIGMKALWYRAYRLGLLHKNVARCDVGPFLQRSQT